MLFVEINFRNSYELSTIYYTIYFDIQVLFAIS